MDTSPPRRITIEMTAAKTGLLIKKLAMPDLVYFFAAGTAVSVV
jgi:hypothetical protein